MPLLLFNSLFLLTFGCFIVLFLFSIMAFCNAEGLKIKEGKHIASGLMLIINSLVYLVISLLLKWKINKERQKESEGFNLRQNSLIELEIRKEDVIKSNNRYD